jgi:hypothetical protein
MISVPEFNIMLNTLTHPELLELDRMCDALPQKTDEAILDTFCKVKMSRDANSITEQEFSILLSSLTHDEGVELASIIQALPNATNDAVLEAYFEYKRNASYRALLKMIEEDPFFRAMESGLRWGDMDAPKPRQLEVPDDDEDWIMPHIRSTVDIFRHFPVVVRELNLRNGHEVHKIEWHMKKFNEQRSDCEHGYQYMDFEETQERRLFKSLHNSPHWIVEAPASPNEICRIVAREPQVVKQEQSVEKPVEKPEANADGWTEVKSAKPKGIVLTSLADIKQHFPTAFWNKVQDNKVSMYNVGLMRKTQNRKETLEKFLTALDQSAFWKVVPYTDNDHCCRIVMNRK